MSLSMTFGIILSVNTQQPYVLIYLDVDIRSLVAVLRRNFPMSKQVARLGTVRFMYWPVTLPPHPNRRPSRPF
jgi:hypothetical protein